MVGVAVSRGGEMGTVAVSTGDAVDVDRGGGEDATSVASGVMTSTSPQPASSVIKTALTMRISELFFKDNLILERDSIAHYTTRIDSQKVDFSLLAAHCTGIIDLSFPYE
jgi:hypothetical protein